MLHLDLGRKPEADSGEQAPAIEECVLTRQRVLWIAAYGLEDLTYE
jgi:hypothetical protein